MMKDLEDKIIKFDINWEFTDNHLQLQQEIDENQTFRLYKEEISEPSRSAAQAENPGGVPN